MKNRVLAVLQAVGGLGVSLAVLVGVPVLLFKLAGNPFPSSVPTIDGVVETLTQSGTGFSDFVIGGLALLLWFIWFQVLVAFLVEIAATLGRRQTRPLPTLPGVQSFAARLVASMTLATTLATVPVLAPAVQALSFDSIEPTTFVVPEYEAPTPDSGADEMHARRSASDQEQADRFLQANLELRVSQPTELWDLAEAVYGDGVSWKLIAESNAGRVDASGRTITKDTEAVAADSLLLLESAAATTAIEAFGELIQATNPDRGSVPTTAAFVTPEATQVASEADAATVHKVERGDTMWSVAEDVIDLRDGSQKSEGAVAEYWAEVVDANRERVTSGHVDLIYPGEELLLPATPDAEGDRIDEQARNAEQSTEESAVADSVVGELASAAPSTDRSAEQAAPESASLVDSPIDTTIEEFATGEPVAPAQSVEESAVAEPVARAHSVEESGEELAIDETKPSSGSIQINPVVTAVDGLALENAGDGHPIVANSGGPSSITSIASAHPSSATSGEQSARQLPLKQVGLAAFGASLLAAGVVAALGQRRSLQRRQRPQGELPKPLSSPAAAFDAALVHSAALVTDTTHGAGWRMLSPNAVAAASDLGAHELHLEPDGNMFAVPLHEDESSAPTVIELTPDPPLDLAPSTDDRGGESDGQGYASASIVVGTDLATGNALLLDLGATGAIAVEGDKTAVRSFVRTAMLDLAVSKRADDLCIIGVDVGGELQDLERVRTAPTYADALAQAVHCGHGIDSQTPVVVVAADAPPTDSHTIEALRDLGALLLAPGIQAPVRIALTGDRASVWPHGSTVLLSGIGRAEYAAVAELVDCSAVTATEPGAQAAEIDQALDVVATDACPIEPGPIEVSVLGPVDVVGAAPFSSLKATDVITYLAFHRNGADADQIKSWVWPPFDPPSDKAFANVMSRARTGLGANDDGEPFVSRAGSNKTYSLAAAVTTDFDRFRGIVELADMADDDASALGYLQQALELIRGIPFSGGSASSFAWADNHVRSHVEFTIDEAVHRCADLALRLEDLQVARWAALKGLELVPGCEQCFRRRFLVASADQNRNELRRAMADLERSAMVDMGDPEAVDVISHDLLDLYQQLDRELVAGAP